MKIALRRLLRKMSTDFPTAAVGSSQAPTATVEKSIPASNTKIQTVPSPSAQKNCARVSRQIDPFNCQLIRRSSLFLPAIQFGARPRPLHVAPLAGSLYFGTALYLLSERALRAEFEPALRPSVAPPKMSCTVRPYSATNDFVFPIASAISVRLVSSISTSSACFCLISSVYVAISCSKNKNYTSNE